MVKKDIYKASVYITYIYWDHKFDEWISDIGTRFAPLHAHTYTEGGVLKCQQRIEALDERNVWLEAFVCEETPNKVHTFLNLMFKWQYCYSFPFHNFAVDYL